MELFDQAIILENDRTKLYPRTWADFEGTLDIALDRNIWKWYPHILETEDQLRAHFQDCERLFQAKSKYTFAIVDKKTDKIAGSTSFQFISDYDKRLEIGWTWLGMDYQGTGLNKACKLLQLEYVFDVLQYERVEFKADVLNLPSVKAMEKLGATREGVLRNRRQMFGNRRRDTVYYSILKDEWPDISKRLGRSV